MTRIRFNGYTLGSALSAPHTGTPRLHRMVAGPPLPVTVPVTTVTPSRTQREPASPGAESRHVEHRHQAPSVGPTDEERRRASPHSVARVSQARIRASYLPQTATPVVCAVSVRPPRAPDPAGKPDVVCAARQCGVHASP